MYGNYAVRHDMSPVLIRSTVVFAACLVLTVRLAFHWQTTVTELCYRCRKLYSKFFMQIMLYMGMKTDKGGRHSEGI